MKAVWQLLPLALLWTLHVACDPGTLLENDSEVAEVAIGELPNQEYTRYEFSMEQQDGSFVVPRGSFDKGGQAIQVKVPVGSYLFTLEYYQDQTLKLSSKFCAGSLRNDVQKLVAGLNEVTLNVCNAAAESGGSTVVIKPKPIASPTPTPTPTSTPSAETFRIQDGRLLDVAGKEFIFRGINMPFAYYFDQSFAAIEHAKASGFNAVRIVWCADTFLDGARCQNKDLRTPADLDRVLTKLSDQKLVTVFNLQNATGQDNVESLQKMADYLIRADIKGILMKHRRSVIINIANEWLGSWTKNRTWVDGYKAVITKIRAAGLPHVLVVDARGYGQDFSSIEESATELLALDKNLLFSSHMYAVYNTDQIVQEKLNYIRTRKIPYIIGEFGCSHYDDEKKVNNTVACEAILRETANSAYRIGTLAWSFTGNRSEEVDLDVFSSTDWRTLTTYGARVINGTFGAKATSKLACFFDSTLCPS